MPNSATVSVDIPSSLTPGVYYLGAVVDSGGTITESDETNNTTVSTTQISVGLASGQPGAVPDLQMTSVSAPTTVVRGTPFNVDTVLTNLLQPAVTSLFSVGIYLSTDTTITTADYRAAQIDYTVGLVDAIGNPINSDSRTTSVTLPISVPVTASWNTADPYFCGVTPTATQIQADAATCGVWKLDGSGALSNESFAGDGEVELTVPAAGNNVAVGLSNTHTETCTQVSICHGLRGMDYALVLNATSGDPLIQLKVYEKCALPFPCSVFTSSVAAGQVIRVKRVGTTIKYYKDNTVFYTSTVPSSGTLFADVSLNSGGSISTVTLTAIPVSAGAYYLGAIADNTSAITELSENNNIAVNTASGTSMASVVSIQSTQAAGSTGSGGGALLWLLCPLLAGLGWRIRPVSS